jgi:uncharacterized membrane protein (DUF2068 family)
LSISTSEATEARSGIHRDRGLLAIGLFKLVEAIFFFLIGVGAIHFIHGDLGDAALRVAHVLRVDPESHFVNLVLDKLDGITAHRLREIGVFTFAYAVLRLTEGVGLMLEQTWAEYLTVGLTVSFLPWELYELVRRPDWLRAGLLLVNLGVLAYLIWQLQLKRPGDDETAA